MSSVVFYRDSSETFECDIKIEGTSYSKTKTRLILEFSDRSLMFPGFISEGHVSIEIPRLSGIQDKMGKAILEVIADSTYFEAWTSDFEIQNKQSVQVSEVKIGNKKPSIVIESVSKEKTEKPKTKKSPNICKETCSDKNKKYVSETFNRFNNMKKSEKKKVMNELKTFSPNPTIQKWADVVFNDSSTKYAKLCMMNIQNKF